MASDRFEYAKWQLTERGNPEPLRKELARLEKTSTGAQVIEAQKLLAEAPDEAPAVHSGE